MEAVPGPLGHRERASLDARRHARRGRPAALPGTKDAIEVVAWLRVIGFNLLAAWRVRAPRKDQQPLSWRRAMEQPRGALVAILLPDSALTVLA